MLVTADRDRCCGSGNCVLTAPDVFDQSDEDGLVVVRQPTPGPDRHDAARRAAELCPARAIEVTDGARGGPTG
jgi:ferredoxin